MSGRPLILLIVLVAAASVCVPQAMLPAQNAAPLLYTVAAHYDPLAWIHGGERFSAGAAIFVSASRASHPLVTGFVASADANVYFDGSRILFAGKKRAQDPWQVWEIAARGGTPRQVTHCEDDCVRPFYLPEQRFVYAHKVDGRFVLEIAALDSAAEKPLLLSHAPGNFLPADVLRDGRILFAASQPLGGNDLPELYTVYSDGSGVEAYRCDHGRARYAGKQVASGDIVFSREGQLYRFTSALAHEVEVPAPAGVYAGDVAETADGAWLVSWHESGQKYFELRRWNKHALQPEISKFNANVVQPVLLASGTIPNRHPSGLHDWTYANVLCLNAYTSKFKIADGAIASVRLYTRDTLGATRLLGASQVEKDGSFYLRVPGDQPLQIELLDGTGATLKKEAGWFWLRSGEQRVCVGCHAGPETAPENTVPAVLLRSTVAADLTGANASSSAGGH